MTRSKDTPEDAQGSPARNAGQMIAWWWFCWAAGLIFCGVFEYSRLLAAVDSPGGALSWFFDWNAETTLPFLVLAGLPLLRLIFGRGNPTLSFEWFAGSTTGLRRLTLASALLFCVSFVCSCSIGFRSIQLTSVSGPVTEAFADLPPAYHDEFSYLLQARTFLAGRLAWPAMRVRPELFHQVHVLNQPATASRYFPWTGLWTAPFELIGHPIVGHWLAGSIACVFFFLSLTQLVAFPSAFVGGLLIAVSPGIAVFSNLLLAHHPTMMALAVFLWSFLKMLHSRHAAWAAVSGSALTLAMLGRPMTAAGFALPYGVYMLFWLSHQKNSRPGSRPVSLVLAMGLPLLLGAGFLMVMNQRITGHWHSSPYQVYTDEWTPRHRYGFDNAVRGAERVREGNVLESYDRWATNLTPAVAAVNVAMRIEHSVLWTLGILPLSIGLLMAFPLNWSRRADRRIRLLWLSILSLHAAHVPYWYDGIMHWHYVFETGPLLLMLCGCGLMQVVECVRTFTSRRVAMWWTITLAASALLPGWLDADSLWGPSKVSLAVSEQSFSRIRMKQFQLLTQSKLVQKPCLILVDENDTDPQISYIINPPDLHSAILVCRLPRGASALTELRQAYRDRTFYVFDPKTFELSPL